MDINPLCRPARPTALPLAGAGTGTSGVPSAGERAQGSQVATAAAYETSPMARGRIMARLSAAPQDAWVIIAAPVGTHGQEAVAAALEGLRSDGLAETDGSGRWRLPGG
jgi:hypothetical protein